MRLKNILTALFVACVSLLASAADDVHVLFTVNPPMHCVGCENKIKGNLRFEKGIKGITTSVENQVVDIRFNPEKTDVSHLIEAFRKIGYEATPIEDCDDSEAAAPSDAPGK